MATVPSSAELDEYLAPYIGLPSPKLKYADFDRRTSAFLVLLYDRTKDSLSLHRDERLQGFIYDNSSIQSMKLCNPWNKCNRRLCPWCSSRVAAKTRLAIREPAQTFEQSLTATLTTESVTTLSEAWRRQQITRANFLRKSWLTSRCRGWFRQTEITIDPVMGLWHCHDHIVIFHEAPEALAALQREVWRRWLDSASRAGVRAAPAAQYVTMQGSAWEPSLYASKSWMSEKDHPTTPGWGPTELLARAVAGEVDALRWQEELESLFAPRLRHRMTATGGIFRGWKPRLESGPAES